MTLAILAIHFIDFNYNLPDNAEYKFNASIATAGCFIMIPLVDTSRIIILRLWKRQSPFKPDKSHIHHAIMRLGKSHSQTTVILTCTQIFFVVFAVVLKEYTESVVLSGIILLSIILSVSLDRLILKRL
jgi:isoprenylcysteine carboxyl methyltransferase (ICMT) family protein YpbQ